MEHPLFTSLIQFFAEDDWPLDLQPDQLALRTGFKGNSARFSCLGRIHAEQEQVLFYSVADTYVPEDQRHRAAEYLTRANYGLRIGNFELDFSDGEVRYKTSLDIEGGELTQVMVRNLVYANVTTVDRYFPGLLAVVFGNKQPAEAIAEIEG